MGRPRKPPTYCSQDDGKLAKAQGLCSTHHARLARYGTLKAREYIWNSGECIVDGCTKKQRTKHMCHSHYDLTRRRAKLADRVRKVTPSPLPSTEAE